MSGIVNWVKGLFTPEQPEQTQCIITGDIATDIKNNCLRNAWLGKETIDVNGIDYHVTVVYFKDEGAATRYGLNPEYLPVSKNPANPYHYAVYYQDPSDGLIDINYSLEQWPPIVEAEAQAADAKFTMLMQPQETPAKSGVMAGAKLFAGQPPELVSENISDIIREMHPTTALSYVKGKIGEAGYTDGNAGHVSFGDTSYPVVKASLIDNAIAGSPLEGHEYQLMNRAGYVRVNVTQIPQISGSSASMCTVEFVVAGETHVWNVPLPSTIEYSGPGEYYIPQSHFFLERQAVT